MQNIRIPPQFTVIQNRECIVELKSQYHYWRLTQHDDFYILAHKYFETDSYHKQCTGSEPQSLIRYIIRHDKAFEHILNS